MLRYEEFRKLSTEEKCLRYKELSNEDKFLARTSDVPASVIVEEHANPPKDSDEWFEKAKKEMDERIEKMKKMREK